MSHPDEASSIHSHFEDKHCYASKRQVAKGKQWEQLQKDNQAPEQLTKAYDFVIIGAGTAGCVVAQRLIAEEMGWNVLVLEAGPCDAHVNDLIHAPYWKYELWGNAVNKKKSPVDWGYATQEQELPSIYTPGTDLKNPSTNYPRGRVWGGSSATNALIYMRGHPEDYDEWGTLTGFKDWNWPICLKAFKACEKNMRDNIDPDYHGFNGLLQVEDLKAPYPVIGGIIEAAGAVNIRPNTDFNGMAQAGAGFYQVTMRNGERCTFADNFLKQALTAPFIYGDKNKIGALNVISDATVTRLEMADDEHGKKKVEYVVYFYDGYEYKVKVNMEVVLCAGALNSPQILMLSGIGPKEHLEEMDIPVQINSKHVGQNLMDHPLTPVTYKVKHRDGGSSANTRVIHTSNGSEAGISFQAKTDGSMPEWSSFDEFYDFHTKNLPDIQISVAPSVWDGAIASKFPAGQDGITICPCLNQAKSLGEVKLFDKNPLSLAKLITNYYKDPVDMTRMISAVKLTREIGKQAPFSTYWEAEELTFEPKYADPSFGNGDTDAKLEKFIRLRTSTSFHPSCTTKMGKNIHEGVVDSKLTVWGTTNLRVADASVFPTVPRGNLNAPTGMVAYRAADFLIAKYLLHGEVGETAEAIHEKAFRAEMQRTYGHKFPSSAPEHTKIEQVLKKVKDVPVKETKHMMAMYVQSL